MTAGAAAAGSDGKAGTGIQLLECKEAWPGSCGAKVRLVALCHHPTAAAARGHCQQHPHPGPRGFLAGKQHRRGEQGNPTSSHRQEGSEGWRRQELPPASSQLLSLPLQGHTQGIWEPRHNREGSQPWQPLCTLRALIWQHPLVPQVPLGCPRQVQSAPAPQDPPATPPAPPCSPLGLIQQLPAIL